MGYLNKISVFHIFRILLHLFRNIYAVNIPTNLFKKDQSITFSFRREIKHQI
jgi:hypothetical protein